jgi:UDP-N-acetylglucosamine 2-epimerase
MKIATIVGARPQFIKAAAFSRELRKRHEEFLIHTGQHYDYAMSGVFFDGLEMPPPDANLEIGSGNHGTQTGAMLSGIERILLEQKPDWVLVYGDTNSTLAGALAASKLRMPVVHVEAGLRSFNRAMPEEVNRVLTDHVSDLLFCPSQTAVDNLASEGIKEDVHLVGDVMLDVLKWASARVNGRGHEAMKRASVSEKKYLLATVHRSENTDDPSRLSAILEAFNAIEEDVVFPVHPRTRKVIKEQQQTVGANIRLVEPLGYFDMVAMSKGARLILTDSGGLQKEAYWLGVPCVTLRDQTEWVETVESGWNILAGAQREKIVEAVRAFAPPSERPALYGVECVSGKCVDIIEQAGSAKRNGTAIAAGNGDAASNGNHKSTSVRQPTLA